MTRITIPPAALDQDRLKHLLDYNAATGEFHWRVSTNSNISPGDKAGSPSSDGYIFISVDNKKYRAHRLAWLWVHGSFPSGLLDHINRNRSDNRIANLREVSASGNQHNYPIPKHNKSGVMGVHWYSRGQKWRAGITINGKHKYLGLFDSLEAAATARRTAKAIYHPLPLMEKPDAE